VAHSPKLQDLCLLLLWMPVVIGCSPAAPPAAKRPPPDVTVAVARGEEVIDYDEFVGRTEPFETVEVRSRVSGFVEVVKFEDGQTVTEGQLLCKIESETYDAAHKQDLARIAVWESKNELAKANLERRKPLFEKKVITKQEYDETVAAVKETEASVIAAQADAARSKLDVKYTEVTAPIAGRIDRSQVSKGNLVSAGGVTGGTLLTRIVNNQPMYVYFDVDERSFLKYRTAYRASADASVKTTQALKIPCAVQLAGESDYPHKGLLDFVESQIDVGTGSIAVRGIIPNEDSALLGGAFVKVQVPLSKPYQAVVIPERAIASDQGTKYVYVVGDDNVAERKNIEPGKLRGHERVILKGLKAGQKVVVQGLQRTRPGEKVSPTAEKSTPAPAKKSTEESAPAEKAPAEKAPAEKPDPAEKAAPATKNSDR
jgi:RND family efflux transporter MFP subunit